MRANPTLREFCFAGSFDICVTLGRKNKPTRSSPYDGLDIQG